MEWSSVKLEISSNAEDELAVKGTVATGSQNELEKQLSLH